jgi:hypothetical protein
MLAALLIWLALVGLLWALFYGGTNTTRHKKNLP